MNSAAGLPILVVPLLGSLALVAADTPAGGGPTTADDSGNTPLHAAALRGDTAQLESLLAAGADPNGVNAAGATPLHYAVASERMASALLSRGARPDVRSHAGVTPLLGAVSKPDSFPVARRLIEAGANLDAQRGAWTGTLGNASVLALAIAQRDSRTVALLLERGAEINPPAHSPVPGARIGTTPLQAAAMVGDVAIARELLRRGAEIDTSRGLSGTALNTAFFAGNPAMAKFLIERGANLTAPSQRGYATPPMVWSAYNDGDDASMARLLVEKGLDVNAANEAGETALSYALKNGSDTAVVQYLRSVGARAPSETPRSKATPDRAVPAAGPARTALVRERVQRAIDLLQRNSTAFLENGFVRNGAKCVSCHQQALPAVAFGLAWERGLRIDPHEVGRLVSATLATRSEEVEKARQMDEPTPGRGLSLGYDADGLHALGYGTDANLEIFSRYLLHMQHPDGSWAENIRRPPMGDGAIVATAWSLRAVQLYPPTGHERDVAGAMRRARAWLTAQPTRTQNERVFQLLGLAWAGENPSQLRHLADALRREQLPSGGWAQLPGLERDAWATGSALVALQKAGVSPTDDAYRRGVDFLLRTQFDDGSWRVRSRSWPFQPHFDGKFPHGKDQWISAAGTAWASIALLHTLEATGARPLAREWAVAFRDTESKRPPMASIRQTVAAEPKAGGVEFTREIQPILDRSCAGCHDARQRKGGFALVSRESLLKGGQSGDPAVVPGNADASPLFRQAAGLVEDLEMPPLHRREKYPPLSDAELHRLQEWINAGAPWPATASVGVAPRHAEGSSANSTSLAGDRAR